MKTINAQQQEWMPSLLEVVRVIVSRLVSYDVSSASLSALLRSAFNQLCSIQGIYSCDRSIQDSRVGKSAKVPGFFGKTSMSSLTPESWCSWCLPPGGYRSQWNSCQITCHHVIPNALYKDIRTVTWMVYTDLEGTKKGNTCATHGKTKGNMFLKSNKSSRENIKNTHNPNSQNQTNEHSDKEELKIQRANSYPELCGLYFSRNKIGF